MLKKLSIVLLTAFCWQTLLAQGMQQTTWVTVKDKFGNLLQVQENIITGAAHRVWGLHANINQYGVSSFDLHQGNIDGIAKRFLTDYQEIIKIDPRDLTLVQAKENAGRWSIIFSQTHRGTPVYKTSVSFTIRVDGTIHDISADIYPNLNVDQATPSISSSEALEIAQEYLKADGIDGEALNKDASLWIYPEVKDEVIEYPFVYEINFLSRKPPKEWIYFLNAQSGKILLQDYMARHSSIGEKAY